MAELRDLYQEVILEHSKAPRNLSRAGRRRITRPRATTRCAATASRSISTWTATRSATSAFRARAARSRKLPRR